MPTFITARIETLQNYFATQHWPGADLVRLLSWQFWTESDIAPASEYAAVSLLYVALIIAALVIWRRTLKKKHARVPVFSSPIIGLANLVFLIVLMTGSYFFFRSQELAYVSSRLVVLGTIFICLGWLIWIIWQLKRTVPSARASYLEKERFSRYIPKKQEKR